MKTDEIVNIWQSIIDNYPKVNHYKIDKEYIKKEFIRSSKDPKTDYWLIFDNASENLIGTATCRENDGMINLLSVKIKQEYFKNEPNAALVFDICQYYLNECGFKYVCDGERAIRHITNYQNFLISVLGFHNAPCKLHIVYHPLIKPIVTVLFPFKKIIQKLEKYNKLVYNISTILKQEEIARKFKN